MLAVINYNREQMLMVYKSAKQQFKPKMQFKPKKQFVMLKDKWFRQQFKPEKQF